MAVTVERLSRITLNSADPKDLARFYIDTLGFSREAGTSNALLLALGATRLHLRHAAGQSYPPEVPGWSLLFQHCAILVADMARAMRDLETRRDWTPISTNGPEHLLESPGGVTAFKFRDPEGHPLELLELPDALAHRTENFLRIDHSAISVADTEYSIAFYTSLGLEVGAHSLNAGPRQERLDHVRGATVAVTALAFSSGVKPHVELLGYRGAFDRNVPLPGLEDIAATRLVFAVRDVDAMNAIAERHSGRLFRQDRSCVMLRDPDGHLIVIEVC